MRHGRWLAVFLTLVACKPTATPPQDPVWRGVALGLFASVPDYDYADLVAEIAYRGASDVLLVVPWYQANATAHAMAPRPGYSPADATITRTIRQAQAKGLRVGLMPIVRLVDRSGGAWRGELAPKHIKKWFHNYEQRVTALAQQAKAAGAHWLVVGSELNSLQRDPIWPGLFSRLRPLGLKLAWSANWDAFQAFPHWAHVDLIGVTGYFPLGDDPAAAWAKALPQLKTLRAKHRKPLLLTEVGWPARATAAARPWDDSGAAEPKPRLQAALWRAFCDAAAPAAALDGFFAWNWFGIGGPRDAGYSLRGKPGAAALGRCFERRWRTP